MTEIETIGFHYVVEAAGCDPEVLGNADRIRQIFLEAAKVGNMEVKASYFFKFSPTGGVSGVVIVAESTSQSTPGRRRVTPHSTSTPAAPRPTPRRPLTTSSSSLRPSTLTSQR